MRHDVGTVSERFASIASRFGESRALTFRDGGAWSHWTYRALTERCGRIARALEALGVKPGDAVGLVAARQPDTIAAMVAIVSTGAHYVPLDVTHPPARLRLLCQATASRYVITDGRPDSADRLPSTVTLLDVDQLARISAPTAPVSRAESGEAPAYVMFTSGSTGEPKGVVVPHRAILRLVDHPNFMRLDATRVFLHLAPLSFDASTLEIWGPLLNGGTCALYPDGEVPRAALLRRVIGEANVNCAWLTASLFNAIVDADPFSLTGLEDLLVGGEALSVSHVRKAMQALPGTQLINGYGPTENTTFTACYRIPADFPPEEASVPIGLPITGTQVLIVDELLRPVPPGGEGELVACGDGLALGYLDRPQLTAERFISVAVSDGTAVRGYRTGDRAVCLADGSLVFLGRIDEQVKIDGHRIEPGEIERVTTSLPGVDACRVLVRLSPSGEKRLAAYVVASDAQRTGDLRAKLSDILPTYMLPHFVVFLDALPMNSNGKLDRAALPDPFAAAAPPSRVKQTPECTAVSECWGTILGRSAIAEDVNFFDAGGTSLEAVRLEGLLARRFARVLAPTFVFENPTIRRQADALHPVTRNEPQAVSRGEQRRASLARHVRGSL
jgi:amino acid adenylation domain-containing protein